MIRYLSASLLILVLALAPLLAFAQPTPGLDLAIADGIAVATATPAPAVTPIPETADPSAALPLVMKLVEAVEQGQYAIAAGLALMILTFLATRIPAIRAKVPKDYTATFLLGTALFGSFGASLAGGAAPGRAAFAALVCSSMAIAFHEAVAKHVIKAWQARSGAKGVQA